MSFTDKVVLVTGAASGIGNTTASLLIREGASVVMTDKDGDKLELASQRCGGVTIAIQGDVTNDDDATRIIQSAIEKFGKLDVLVNCAGNARFGSILNGDLMKSYDDLINVHLRAIMKLTSLAAPHLISTKGNIVNIASTAGLKAHSPNISAYSVVKAGVLQFTRVSALELAPHGVRVNSVSPSSTNTDLLVNSGIDRTWDDFKGSTLFNRILDPVEVADMILYLASDKAKGVTGSNFLIDNGTLLK